MMQHTHGIAQTVAASREAFGGVFELISDIENESFRQGASTFLNAVLLFGECELTIKRAERVEILYGAGSDLKSCMESDALNINAQGLQLLERAIEEFSGKQRVRLGVRDPRDPEETDYDFTGATREGIDGFVSSLRSYLLDSQVKPTDVGEIWEIVQEVSAIGGSQELREYVLDKSRQLLEYRASATRGTDKNIPWWKVCAIAVILGISVYGVACCLRRWCGCSKVAGAAANLGLSVASLVLRFC